MVCCRCIRDEYFSIELYMKIPVLNTKQLILVLIGIALVTINPRINGWNEASRMALTQSLVEQHSFIIDESVMVRGGDKVFINDHFYSDKPALPSMLGAIVYAPLYALGLKLDYGWNLSYYLIILFTLKVFWIASILAFRASLSYTPISRDFIQTAVLVYALASLSFTWSASFNNHSLAGSSLMIGFFLYLKGKHSGTSWNLLGSGLFFGLAASMDMPTTIFLLGFMILVCHTWGWKITTLGFASGAVVPLLISLAVNYSIGKTFIPLQINPDFFVFEGSSWSDPESLSGISLNTLGFTIQYAFLSLLGSKGFIWYNPLLVILIPVILRNTGKDRPFQPETWIILAGTLILMSYYFLFSSNYGGWSYSIRWFVPLLPLLCFYLFEMDYLTRRPGSSRLFYGLVTVSIIIALIGLINPWSNQDLSLVPLIANLKQLAGFLT